MLQSIPLGFTPQRLTIDPQAGRVLVVGSTRASSMLGIVSEAAGQLRTVDLGHDPLAGISIPLLHPFVLAVDPQSDRLFVGGDSLALLILDRATGRRLGYLRLAGPAVALAVDSTTQPSRLFVESLGSDKNGGDSAVSGVDIAASRLFFTHHFEPQGPSATYQSGGVVVDTVAGRVMAMSMTCSSLYMFDEATGTAQSTVAVGVLSGVPTAAALDAPTRRLVVVSERSASVALLDADSGVALSTVAVGPSPEAVAIDEHTGHAFVLSVGARNAAGAVVTTGSVSMIDTRSGALLRTTRVGIEPQAIAVDTRSGRVFVAQQGSVSVLDARSGTLLHTVLVTTEPVGLAVDERRGRAVVIGQGGTIVNAQHRTVAVPGSVEIIDATR